MIIDFSVENFASFNSKQELSMVASTSTKENFNEDNVLRIENFGIGSVVKSAALFGANASGKTNFTKAIVVLKKLVLESLEANRNDMANIIRPFLLNGENINLPTEFEISFISNGHHFRYGISILSGEVLEEWLYWKENTRETMLFHREKQTIKYNRRSFSEADDFVEEYDDGYIVKKTKKNIPFISVLSTFDGEISNCVISWFEKLNIISGINAQGFQYFTTELLENDLDFKVWALDILKSFQIDDIRVVEEERKKIPRSKEIENSGLVDVISKLEDFIDKNKVLSKSIEVIKESSNANGKYVLPLSLESEGTRKLIYLLGPLYDVVNNNEILVIDEFDNKFHSLLSRFILNLFHKYKGSKSQLILTCHDTNLLDSDLFRRDQIWFVEKNPSHESQLYSLLEYKEHYARRNDSYGRDYLLGKYGAIPLFSDVQIKNLEDQWNG